MHDLVIRGGTIVDGTGAASRAGDIAITNGVITEVGGRISGDAKQRIDADGMIVTPGWSRGRSVRETTTDVTPGIEPPCPWAASNVRRPMRMVSNRANRAPKSISGSPTNWR